jgi:hypothetical protein
MNQFEFLKRLASVQQHACQDRRIRDEYKNAHKDERRFMKRDLKKHSVKGNGMRNLMSRGVSGLLALAFCGIAHGFLFPQLGLQLSPQLKKGTVMTRAQVLGDNGGPILVVTRTTGSGSGAQTEEIEEIGEIYPEGPLGEVYILSGAEVGYFLDQYARLRIERGETMKRAVFLDPEELANGIAVANGETSESVNLPDSVKTVLVLGERDRFGTDPSRWTLIEFPFLMDEEFTLEDNASSVLFDEEGEQIRAAFGTSDEAGNYSVEQFTYRVGYWGDGEDAMEQDKEGYSPRGDDRIFGPVSGAELDMAFNSGVSGADGRYQLFYMHYCLGLQTGSGFLPLTAPTAASINLVLKASIYNPQGKAYFPLLMQRKTEFFCGDVSGLPDHNFIVDVLWLSGKLRLANTANGDTLPMGDEVLYQGEDRQGEAMAQSSFDFDGDGEPDISVHANKKTETDEEGNSYVIPNQEGEPDSKRWQAVYFSSGSHRPDAESLPEQVPDLWRLADHVLDTKETGLYSQITQDVLVNTDLYVFHESTGELIVELNGMPDGIGDGRDLTEDGDYFTYNTVMRGPKQHGITRGLCNGRRGDDCLLRTLYDGSGDADRALLEGNGDEAYQLDAEQLGFQSRFQQRDGGLPAPGEWMYVVAINRTTGYTGTVRFQLGQPYGEGAIGPSITQRVPEITLTPPNLKVWAKRVYDIEKGLTKDETVNYLIGHEGAATQNDTLVGIYTEWLDGDGRPLPVGLDIDQGKDFGLSGRLAKIVGDELVPVSSGVAVEADDFDIEEAQQGSQIAEFPIGPGQRLQLLRLKADNTSNEHYYVNVFGRAVNKEACSHCEYTETDKQQDLLTGRPNHYTPFYVPRYDEVATLELELERNKLRVEEAEEQEEGEAPPDDEDKLGKVDAQYEWMLRPEYQFTLLDIEVNELNAVRKQINEDGSEEEIVRNLIDEDQPVITSTDDLIRILYNLILPEDDALQGLDGPREYVLALGEEEVRITAGEDQTIDIENLDHLASLDVEDFLTMRLYLSNDQENVLWQWAFDHMHLDVAVAESEASDDECYYVSADEPEVLMFSAISSFNEDRLDETVSWRLDGPGTLEHYVREVDDLGFTTNTLTLSRFILASNEPTIVNAYLNGSTDAIKYEQFCVVAGKPADMVVTHDNGVVYSNGVGSRQYNIFVTDAWGNPVQDGTPLTYSADGGLKVIESEEFTVNGYAQAKVVASDIGYDNQQLTIAVDGVDSHVGDIDVSEMTLSMAAPDTLPTGATGAVALQLNPPLLGVSVFLSSDVGLFPQAEYITDINGRVIAEIQAANIPVLGHIRAMSGLKVTASKAIEVTSNNTAHFQSRALIGDADTSGKIITDDGWGNEVEIDYHTDIDFTVTGDEGDVLTLGLGTDEQPIHQNLVYYKMESAAGGKAYDQAGSRHAELTDIISTAYSPRALQRSYGFNLESGQNSRIILSDASGLASNGDWQIYSSVKPNIQSGEANIFTLANGVELLLGGSSRVLLNITTLNGVESINGGGISTDDWSSLRIRKIGLTVELWVNESLAGSLTLTDDIAYTGSTLTIGENYRGLIDEFRMVDMSSSVLATFADGSINKVVTIGATGRETVTIISTGALNSNAKVQPIGLQVNDSESHELHILSKEVHRFIVLEHAFSDSNYITFLIDGVELAQQPLPLSLPFISRAYAQESNVYVFTEAFYGAIYSTGNTLASIEYGFLVDRQFWNDFGEGLVEFGKEEKQALQDNLAELSDEVVDMIEDGDVEGVDAALVLLRVAVMYPPIRRTVGPKVLVPMIKFLKRFRHNKVGKLLADKMMPALRAGLKGDFDPLFGMMYGIVFLAEIIEVLGDGDLVDLHDTALDLIQGIESMDDLDGIFLFVKAAVPSLDETCTASAATSNTQASSLLSLLPQAHAAGIGSAFKLTKFLDVKAALKVFSRARAKVPNATEGGGVKSFKLSKFVARLGYIISAADVVDANGSVSDSAKEVLENLLDENMITTLMIVSHLDESGAISDFIRGKLPLRTGILPLVSAIAYIESKIEAGELDVKNYQNYAGIHLQNEFTLDGRIVKWKIRDKYKRIFINVKPKKVGEASPTAYAQINAMNGEAFHLIKVASLLNDGKRIIGIESPVNVQLKTEKAGVPKSIGPPLLRRVDIVTGTIQNAKWHEVKSLAYNTHVNGRNKPHVYRNNLTTLNTQNIEQQADKFAIEPSLGAAGAGQKVKVRSNQFYAKEFFLDRAYAAANTAVMKDKMEWTFHDFYKSDMPKLTPKTSGSRAYVMDNDEFTQCGIGNLAACNSLYGTDTPLAEIREKLTKGVRNPGKAEVKSIVAQTVLGGMDEDDVDDYLDDVYGIRSDIIHSMNAKSWLLGGEANDFVIQTFCER